MSKPKYQDEDFQSTWRPINLPEPSASHHPATKNYVDNAIMGIKWKYVRARAGVNVDISQLNDGDSLGGVTVATDDRVLLDDQSTASQDGVYVVGATAGTTVRATDVPTGFDARGLGILVGEGTHGNKLWLQTAEPAVVGTDGLTFSAVEAGVTYTADGQGIELSSTTFGLELDGSTLSKSASGLKVADGYATGLAGAGLTNSGNVLAVGAGTGVTVNANDIAIDTSITARWASALGPASAGSSITQAHSRGHAGVMVQVRRVSDGLDITDGVEVAVDTTNIVVTFGASQADRSAFRLIWVG